MLALEMTMGRASAVLIAALGASTVAASSAQSSLSESDCVHSPNEQVNPTTIVSDTCASYAELDKLNTILHPYIQSITEQTEFFSYYRLNLFNKQCPFWSDDDGMCGNIACSVNTLDNEDDIPLVWRAEELGKINMPADSALNRNIQTIAQPGKDTLELLRIEPDSDNDDSEYCFPDEQEKGDNDSVYVSLINNPERFTGYAGAGARKVWETIYRENCFTREVGVSRNMDIFDQFSGNSLFGHDLYRAAQKQEFEEAIQKEALNDPSPLTAGPLEFENECLEKRVFHRVVSGMHSSISTHLCWDHLNQTTGQWGPNLECFRERVYNHPNRVSNVYFNYALLLRATSKLRSLINHVQFRSADPDQDELANRLLASLATAIPSSSRIFDESIMFNSEDAVALKLDFRVRFRNIGRIMDCVGCDKCRLWGKIQTTGYGTALKILFEFDEAKGQNGLILRRTELVALINTLARVSNSLNAIGQFRTMIEGKRHPVASPKKILPQPAKAATLPKMVEIKEEEEEEEEETLMDIFLEELELMCKMFKFVLLSWWNLPKTVGRIISFEFSRFWAFWLGLEPPKDGWYFRFPDHREVTRSEL